MFPRFFSTESTGPARPRPLALEPLDERAVPAVVANNDVYGGTVGRVLSVDANNGVLNNDFSTDSANSVLTAAQVSPIVAVGSSVALPANTLTLSPNGSFTLVVPSNLPASVTQLQFNYRAANVLDPTEPTATATVTINIAGTRQQFLAVGPQSGAAPVVKVFDVGTANLRYSFQAYEPSFTGGVRVATGDLNGDGIDDIVTAPGVGGGDRVKVFDGKTLNVLFDGPVLNDPNFRGGLYVATGDVEGDGNLELIVGAGEQGAPRVVVLDIASFGPRVGAPFVVLADFFAYESTFRNGVRVAAGDLDGSGVDQIVTAPGAGGGPVIKAFAYQQVGGNNAAVVQRLAFLSGDARERGGAFVATGDVGGTGREDIIVGSGTGLATVGVFNGTTGGLIRQFNVPTEEVPIGGGAQTGPNAAFFNPLTDRPSGTLLAPVEAPRGLTSGTTTIPGSGFNPTGARNGTTVTAADWNGDGLADVITGTGPGNPSRVRVFDTRTNAELINFLAYDGSFLGGINVG